MQLSLQAGGYLIGAAGASCDGEVDEQWFRYRRSFLTVSRQRERDDAAFRELLQTLPGHSHGVVKLDELGLRVRVAATDEDFALLWRICERHVGAPHLQLEIVISHADVEHASTLLSTRLDAGESISGLAFVSIQRIADDGTIPGVA